MSGNVAITEKGLQAFKEVTQLTSHVPSCIICLENVCTSIPAKQRQSVPLRGLESEGPSPTLCVHNQSPFILQVLKSHGQDYLVGNRLTRVDIHLLEVLLYVEEFDASLLTPFPLLKVRPPQRGSHTHASDNTTVGPCVRGPYPLASKLSY